MIFRKYTKACAIRVECVARGKMYNATQHVVEYQHGVIAKRGNAGCQPSNFLVDPFHSAAEERSHQSTVAEQRRSNRRCVSPSEFLTNPRSSNLFGS